MKHSSSAERGFSLIVAMIVVVLLTLLVVGAIAFTGSERSAAVQRSRAEGLSSCAEAARSLFLSRIRLIQGEVPTGGFDGGLGPEMRVYSGHYAEADGGSVSMNVAVVSSNDMGTLKHADLRDLSNWIGGVANPNTGGGGSLYATYYRVSAVCDERAGGPQQEVEFVIRVGL